MLLSTEEERLLHCWMGDRCFKSFIIRDYQLSINSKSVLWLMGLSVNRIDFWTFSTVRHSAKFYPSAFSSTLKLVSMLTFPYGVLVSYGMMLISLSSEPDFYRTCGTRRHTRISMFGESFPEEVVIYWILNPQSIFQEVIVWLWKTNSDVNFNSGQNGLHFNWRTFNREMSGERRLADRLIRYH